MKTIDKLIINSPYSEPTQHWHYERETQQFSIKENRRPAGYIIANPNAKGFDDTGIFVEINLVNQIRPRIKKWKENNYIGVTSITKRLLEYWNQTNDHDQHRFFFCQLEAIETLIWLTEAPSADKIGLNIQGDGGSFERWCNKMATGTGKTIIMSMILAWQFLNKVTYPTDPRFSKFALIIAPNLTVKSRLQVLLPSHEKNYYELFNIVPTDLMDKLRQGKIIIHNWHTLAWDNQEKLNEKIKKGQLRSVDRRQRLEISDAAYLKQILGDMANAKNLIIINDEAHHAWRVPAESKIKGIKKEDIEESTIWVGGLDRIHKSRGILRCFDLSATPFAPSGKKANEEALFSWIVSDFGLNDAIESGLVKTPRVVIRDDSITTKELKSRLYHIYMDHEVKENINRKSEITEPLPDLLINAYYLLGKDWLETKKEWEQQGQQTPPVMITVANRTETSARIKYAFEHQQILIPELCESSKILQIDSKVLELAESDIESDVLNFDSEDLEQLSPKLSKKQQAENLRKTVDTVGKIGQLGEQIQNVLSVGMLSEGWDAKNVTHIMGLRAFSSQLLCEQVIGRGLRRVSYEINKDGLFEPEYVNIFGVPFSFLPHEGVDESALKTTASKTKIEPVTEKEQHEIKFPNLLRIDSVYKPHLTIDWNAIQILEINPWESITEADLAAIIAGKPNNKIHTAIGLEKISEETRLQTIMFKVASAIYNAEKRVDWKGNKELFLAQLVRLVEQFINMDKIKVINVNSNPRKRKIILILNMNKIIQHILTMIKIENTKQLIPIFDKENPICSTSNMRTWYTSKPCEWLQKSHISHCVYDSMWEASEAYLLEKSPLVQSFVKNDHVGFAIYYNYQGIVHKYYPDFMVRLTNGEYLILETKGMDNQQHQTKRKSLQQWIAAVNRCGKFGKWHEIMSYNPSDIEEQLLEII